MNNIEKRIKMLELWQDKIVEELDGISSKHAYYSCFSLDARNELKKEHPELFKEEEQDEEADGKDRP